MEDLASYEGTGESLVIGARDVDQALVVEAMIAGSELQSSVLLAYPKARSACLTGRRRESPCALL